jgi:aspartate aminotransferase-like enzyme
MIKPLLFLPGPMQVPDHIRSAADKPLFNHRSPRMLELLSKLEGGVRPLLGAKGGDVVFLASSGTGAMESAIANLTSPGDEIIVLVGGTFSARWAEIASAFGLNVHSVDVDWRSGASVEDVKNALEQWPAAEVIFHTFSESSTGVLNDPGEIGNLIRSRNKFYVVDAVSGLAVSPMQMDEWCVDTIIAGSQKGLMLPAGLSLVAVGPRAWEKYARSTSPRFYWDWKKYKRDVPFTPALSILFQLESSLDYIHGLGLEQLFARRAHVADRVRSSVNRSGLELYARKPGNGITAVINPPGFDSAAVIRRLENDFGIQIAGGLGKLKESTFRIGHVGHVTDEQLDYFIQSFERCAR